MSMQTSSSLTAGILLGCLFLCLAAGCSATAPSGATMTPKVPADDFSGWTLTLNGTTERVLTLDDLRDVRVKAATYGQINERAVYRKGVKPEDFDPNNPDAKMAGPVASPLRVGDCCANADGASCIILANAEKAKIFQKKPVWILGIGAASEVVNMASRPDFSKGIQVAKAAAGQAYKMAGIGPKDVNVAEVHDCFTIAEIMAYEGLGFAPEGDGKQLIREKATYKEGRIPVNVDGGLLSKGHPIGATGGSQIRTIVLQLRDEAGPMQVKDPQIGLNHNIGGVGLYGNVTIFGRD